MSPDKAAAVLERIPEVKVHEQAAALTLGGFFSIALPRMGFGLSAHNLQKPSQMHGSSSPS